MDYDAPPAAIAAPLEDGAARIAIPVYVRKVPRCPPRASDEIVVCAEDPEQFHLRPLPEGSRADDPLPRTRMQLNERTSIGAELESAGVGGQVSNRVMLRGRIKF